MTGLLVQERDLDIPQTDGGARVASPWSNPIPQGESTKSPVVVYFFSDRWIPITLFSLAEAIALYRKAVVLGKELLIYPPGLDPCTDKV